MQIEQVMPWIVVPLVLFFGIRGFLKKKKGTVHNDRQHDPLHENLHHQNDSGGGDDAWDD